jgi:hypothetical protein
MQIYLPKFTHCSIPLLGLIIYMLARFITSLGMHISLFRPLLGTANEYNIKDSQKIRVSIQEAIKSVKYSQKGNSRYEIT